MLRGKCLEFTFMKYRRVEYGNIYWEFYYIVFLRHRLSDTHTQYPLTQNIQAQRHKVHKNTYTNTYAGRHVNGTMPDESHFSQFHCVVVHFLQSYSNAGRLCLYLWRARVASSDADARCDLNTTLDDNEIPRTRRTRSLIIYLYTDGNSTAKNKSDNNPSDASLRLQPRQHHSLIIFQRGKKWK